MINIITVESTLKKLLQKILLSIFQTKMYKEHEGLYCIMYSPHKSCSDTSKYSTILIYHIFY